MRDARDEATAASPHFFFCVGRPFPIMVGASRPIRVDLGGRQQHRESFARLWHAGDACGW